MGHDATKVLMGTSQSSDRAGSNVYDSSPVTFPAGTACRLGSDGLLTTTKGTNKWVGISQGKSLSDTLKTSVLRSGSRVPLLLEATAVVAIGANAYISNTTGKGDVSGAGSTVSDAVYVSGVLSGITEDGTTVDIALVDMVGGL